MKDFIPRGVGVPAPDRTFFRDKAWFFQYPGQIEVGFMRSV